jgi:SAM-dependent methyltransferase
MTDRSDPQTLAFYAADSKTYVSVRPDEISPDLDAFLDRLTPGASILELGCGGGVEAGHMIARGFAVDPTDGVPAMAKEAEVLLGRPVRVMAFDELEENATYDAVVANAALLHVPRSGLPAILGRVHRALRPGGWHLASYKAGGTEGRDEHGRYYNYLSPDDARHYYTMAGNWTSFEIAESIEGGYFGKRGPWIKVTARKA